MRPAAGSRHLSLDPVSSVLSGLVHQVALETARLFIGQLVAFVARMDLSAISHLWRVVSASTEPVLSGPSWGAELSTMVVLAAAAVLPLLCASAIQAIARQDPGGLARTVFVRVPLALLFTGVAVELVSLGLQATDQACRAVAESASQPLSTLFGHLTSLLGGPNLANLSVDFLYLLVAGFLAFVVWIELAVRSAAIALATLFLPLGLAGSAFPATSHWARRLGETLAALVLSKLAIVAALALAAATLVSSTGGLASLTEGVTILGLAAVAPLGLARILPMVESGAIAHLDGLGRHALKSAARAVGSPSSWIASSASSAALGGAVAGHGAGGGGWQPSGSAPEGGDGSGRFGGIGRRPPNVPGKGTPPPPPAAPPG